MTVKTWDQVVEGLSKENEVKLMGAVSRLAFSVGLIPSKMDDPEWRKHVDKARRELPESLQPLFYDAIKAFLVHGIP